MRRRVVAAVLGVVAVMSVGSGPAWAARASGVCGGVPLTPGYVWGPNCTEVPAP